MSFRREVDLQEFLSSRDLSSTSGFTLVRRELPVGGEIPDLLYITFAQQPPHGLWPKRWTFQHAFLVWQLRSGRKLRARTIASRSYLSIERAGCLLDDLVASGTVEQTAAGAFFLASALADMNADVLAVEAKLTRWREALRQAASYQRFADRVAVAMSREGTPTDPAALAAFRDVGVGLCSVRQGEVEWIVPALDRETSPSSAEWEYVVASAADPIRQRSWSRL